MSDTPQPSAAAPQPEAGQPRDAVTGRYVRRHAAKEEPPPPVAMAAPPAPPAPPSGGDTEQKDGRKRWLILLLLLLVLLLLICGGFSYFNWWRKTTPEAVKPSPIVSVTVSPATSPSVSVSPTPTPSVRIVNMPDVVGMPAADAKVILEGAGLGSIRFVDDKGQDLPILASRRVTRQSVAPGASIPVDTAIVITTRVTSNGKG